MPKNTNVIRSDQVTAVRLDEIDRKLLAILSADATRSYVEMGKLLNLSPPALHERVKRMKSEGVIVGTLVRVHGAKVGRPLLAFIHVNTSSFESVSALKRLSALPEVEEIHTITGESSLLLKVRTRDTQGLEELLNAIHGIEGIEGTKSSIALTTYLERGPSPQLS
jgi:Lrp/AsnC family leucine-responsive transcriptional regulator